MRTTSTIPTGGLDPAGKPAGASIPPVRGATARTEPADPGSGSSPEPQVPPAGGGRSKSDGSTVATSSVRFLGLDLADALDLAEDAGTLKALAEHLTSLAGVLKVRLQPYVAGELEDVARQLVHLAHRNEVRIGARGEGMEDA